MRNLTKLLIVVCLAIALCSPKTVIAYNGGESVLIGSHKRFQSKSSGQFLHRVWQEWIPVKGQKWDQVEVAFKAYSDGHLSNLRIDETSKCEAIDNMALAAVRKAAPLDVISNKACSAVDVQLLFVKADISSDPEDKEEIPNEQLLVMNKKPAIEFGPYISALELLLLRNWRPSAWNIDDFPLGFIVCSADGGGKGYSFTQRMKDRRTVISFLVNRSGQFSKIKVAQSSGYAAADRAGLIAVQRSASGPALPKGTPKSVKLEWCFTETDKLYLHILVP